MTVRQAAGRLKLAALVLAGYRPAEVRFDKWDLRIAFVIAYHFEQMFAAVYPDMTVLYDDINMIAEPHICT